MTPTIATEGASGAQLLPAKSGERPQKLTPWLAHLACDADLRRHPEYAAIAAAITITKATK